MSGNLALALTFCVCVLYNTQYTLNSVQSVRSFVPLKSIIPTTPPRSPSIVEASFVTSRLHEHYPDEALALQRLNVRLNRQWCTLLYAHHSTLVQKQSSILPYGSTSLSSWSQSSITMYSSSFFTPYHLLTHAYFLSLQNPFLVTTRISSDFHPAHHRPLNIHIHPIRILHHSHQKRFTRTSRKMTYSSTLASKRLRFKQSADMFAIASDHKIQFTF